MQTLPHNTQRLEQDIVRTLLEQMAEIKAEYPKELYEPTRAEYIHQVTTKMPSTSGKVDGR
jgi:predicted kinase